MGPATNACGVLSPATIIAVLAVALLVTAVDATRTVPAVPSKVKLTLLGYSTPGQITTQTEQVAFDDVSKVAYLVGGKTVYVLDLASNILPIDITKTPIGASSPGQQLPVLTSTDLPATITDVQLCGGYLAISAEGVPGKTSPGQVLIYSSFIRQSGVGTRGGDDKQGSGSLQLLANFTVGALPDQIEFSRNCKTLLVSNEGEPSGYGAGEVDPEGSVSVIDISYCPNKSPRSRSRCNGRTVAGTVRTATFTAWNDKKSALLAMNIKINGPGASVAQDLEPEYTTFSEDEKTAFVSLQENNAVAVLDVKSATITGIYPLGLKDHNKQDNSTALDASDDSADGINIRNWPVYGMYMPDEIKSFSDNGVDYVVMANEGDGRDYKGFAEEGRVLDISASLDVSIFPDRATLGQKSNLGRLTVIKDRSILNDANNDGQYDKILSYGARSFSIYRAEGSRGGGRVQGLTQVFDSGSQLEVISSNTLPNIFNSEGKTDTKDKRSDNKGPEPEGIAVGYAPAPGVSFSSSDDDDDRVGKTVRSKDGKRCLFLTTERLSVVFVYDISDPTRPAFQSIALPPQEVAGGYESARLLAPEGITYARYSISRKMDVPIVLVAFEAADASGMAVYRVDNVPDV